MGVRIHVVQRDLERGVEVISGMAPVVSIATHDVGGIWDCQLGRYVGPSDDPKIWYASERAIDLILHGDEFPRAILAHGAMGSGKTRGVLAQWVVLQCLRMAEFAPIEGGLTAPTDGRLEEAMGAIRGLMRADWYTYYAHSHLLRMRCGVTVRGLGTARRSASQGSRIQGWNWAFHAGDEIQDQVGENANIEARGRRAPHGIYRRLATATAKDTSEWRSLRQHLLGSGQWAERKLEGPSNPFTWPAYWESLKASMSEREYRQMVLAETLGPERAVYPAFDREHHLRPRPQVGARDVTLEKVGAAALLGHDPGASIDVTLMLKCYRIGHRLDQWFVVDEWTTTGTTTQEHALHVRRLIREKWDIQWPEEDMPKAIVRCDPQGHTDAKTSENVYKIWKLAGFKIKSAVYNDRGEPTGILLKDDGIEMVNRLLKAANGQRRLFIDCDDRKVPAAPRLLEALEMSERDEHDRAETQEKGSPKDLSHWCAALRYALWPYERLRVVQRETGGLVL